MQYYMNKVIELVIIDQNCAMETLVNNISNPVYCIDLKFLNAKFLKYIKPT